MKPKKHSTRTNTHKIQEITAGGAFVNMYEVLPLIDHEVVRSCLAFYSPTYIAIDSQLDQPLLEVFAHLCRKED